MGGQHHLRAWLLNFSTMDILGPVTLGCGGEGGEGGAFLFA